MARTKRAQILMEPAEYRQLEVLAAREGVSVAELVREAVRERYLDAPPRKIEAAARITAMALPVVAWEDIDQEIEDAHDAGVR
jgi:hypothetical protein